ncbi:hypothetical protein EDB89DRAFT_2122493 [Lactarius sanguifluus]|nr:hypothetical protein EDB89DRAFT_2122493 [Lactarius sanguifluus]
MPVLNATIDAEPTYTERQLRVSDLHGLSKPALQHIVKSQKDKWPASVHGNFTQKTMRAVLLGRELGFTIRVSEPMQSNLLEGQDEGQIGLSGGQQLPDQGRRLTRTNQMSLPFLQEIDSNEPGPAGPNYGLDRLDLTNPTPGPRTALGEKKDVGHSQIRHPQLSFGIQTIGNICALPSRNEEKIKSMHSKSSTARTFSAGFISPKNVQNTLRVLREEPPQETLRTDLRALSKFRGCLRVPEHH